MTDTPDSSATTPARTRSAPTTGVATRIKVRENGPLLVTGPVSLTDHDGNAIACEGDKIALCRCGLSATKPFCDASHRGEFDGTLASDSPTRQ